MWGVHERSSRLVFWGARLGVANRGTFAKRHFATSNNRTSNTQLNIHKPWLSSTTPTAKTPATKRQPQYQLRNPHLQPNRNSSTAPKARRSKSSYLKYDPSLAKGDHRSQHQSAQGLREPSADSTAFYLHPRRPDRMRPSRVSA